MIIQGVNTASLMVATINSAVEGKEYSEHWSNDYRIKDLDRRIDSALEEWKKIDFKTLTNEEYEFLGFRKMSKESDNYLVPLYLFRALRNGDKLISIMGNEVTYGKDYIDNDIRFGCIAYELIRK